MVSPLSYDDAQAVNAHVHDLAQGADPIAAFHAIMDLWDGHPGLYEAVHVPNPETGITLQNPGPDATRMASKYQAKVAAAAGDYVYGVQNPKRDFKQAAVAANGKWKNRVQEAVTQDRFARAMSQVDSAEAIATAISDQGAAYTAGAAKRQAKVGRVYSRLAPMLGAVSQAVQAMPQDTDAQRAQRLLAARQAMIEVGKRLKGGG
jgi:hypothetical protein